MSKINRESIEIEFAAVKNNTAPEKWEEFVRVMLRAPEVDAYQAQQRRDQRRKDAGQDFFTRKDALILRRVKEQELECDFAPDDDVFAYIAIHRLKKADHETKGTYEEKMKISVSDVDVKAFRDVEDDGHFYRDITIDMVNVKVAATKVNASQ